MTAPSRFAPVLALALACGCGLMLDDLAGGGGSRDAGDTDPDAGSEPCPGYEGFDVDCCLLDDPCGWADDGYCDCDGTCDWDAADCGDGPDGGAALASRGRRS